MSESGPRPLVCREADDAEADDHGGRRVRYVVEVI